MSESDYQEKVDLFLRECIKYPINKPDDDVEMNYKDFLSKIEKSTKDYSKTLSGSIEYYFSAIRYLAYQDWLTYLGYVDNKDFFEVILNNLEQLSSYDDLEMLSREIIGISSKENYTIRTMEVDSDDSNLHLCNERNRFENINRQTLINIAANILYDKMTIEIKTIEMYLSLKK